MVEAYFDDTGTHAESFVTALGGYVGPEEAWSAIEAPWQAILDEFAHKGVRWFHMTDCLAEANQFARVDHPSVNYLITQLAKILGEQRDLQPMMSAVIQDDWNAVVTDANFLKRFPRPIDLCFDDIVRSLTEWGAKKAGGELIVPVFAYSPEYSARMSAIGELYGAEPWYRSTLGAIGFDYPERVIPLQGADLFAHQARTDTENRAKNIIKGPTFALYTATGGRPTLGHWFDAETLESTVEHFNQTGEIYSLEGV